MSLSIGYVQFLYSDIELIYRLISGIGGWDHEQVRKYMDVGEYSLALDDLADAYLRSGESASADLLYRFEALATKMGMENDPEYQAVAELRARQRATMNRS